MNIQVNDQREGGDPDPPVDLDDLKRVLSEITAYLDLPPGDVEVTLLDDSVIRELNAGYRHVDRATNVLAFPQLEWLEPLVPRVAFPEIEDVSRPPILLGEVLLSPAKILADAESAGVPFIDELIRIAIHGLLHLVGYDHDSDADAEIMELREKQAGMFRRTIQEI